MKVCANCGWKNDDAATQCTGCSLELANVAPPVQKLTKAGFWIRAFARIIDMAYNLCIAFVAGMFGTVVLIFMARMGWLVSGWNDRLHQFSFGALALGFIAPLVYNFACEGIHGATLGKLLCGIRVVRENKKPCNARGALLRSIAYLWDCQFLGAVAYTRMQKSPFNQRYGDAWGRTIVLKESELAPESKRDLGFFFFGLTMGTLAYMAVMVLIILVKAI